MTEGPPLRLLLRFILPIMAALIFQQLYNIVDGLIVGQLLGMEAFAAVGSTGTAMYLTLGTFEGLCTGFSIVTATRLGAKDDKGVGRSYTVGMVLTLMLSIISAIGLSLATRPLLHLTQTPEEIFEWAAEYLTVIYAGTPIVGLYSFLTNSMRAVGDSRTPLLLLILACVLNIGLDYAFIALFHMGVGGAAYATIAAQLIAALLCLAIIKKKFRLLQMTRAALPLQRGDCVELFRMGLPMFLQNAVVGVGSMIVQYAVNLMGVIVVAACTAGNKISSVIVQAVLTAFGTGMAPYVAQNVGAGRMDRVREGVRKCLGVSIAMAIFFGAIMILFGGVLTSIFVGETNPEVTEKAHQYLAYMGWSFWILSALFIFRNALQGLGNARIPMLSGMMELVGRTVATLVLQNMIAFTGVCLATPLGWLIATILLAISYLRTARRVENKLERNL